MTETEKKLLSDMIASIGLIFDFTKDLKSFAEYNMDLKTKSAVERQLGIIGKAVNKFQKESASNNLQNASQIISLRNRLIHAYSSVDDSIIWSIITRFLQPLSEEINKKFEQGKEFDY